MDQAGFEPIKRSTPNPPRLDKDDELAWKQFKNTNKTSQLNEKKAERQTESL